jgi:DNA-binding transcriptional regulator GbsR (MarR family)
LKNSCGARASISACLTNIAKQWISSVVRREWFSGYVSASYAGLGDGELYSILATERIRRTIKSCREVMSDLDAERINIESEAVDELYQELEQLSDRLRRDCQQYNHRLLNDSRSAKLMHAAPTSRTRR